MIGNAKNFAAVAASVSYSAWINPSSTLTVSPPGSATSVQVAVSVTGGTAPYTYLWTKSGDPITVSDDTADTVRFSAISSNGAIQGAGWTCTVTDAALAETTANITSIFRFT